MIRFFGLLAILFNCSETFSQEISNPIFEFEFPIKNLKEKGVKVVRVHFGDVTFTHYVDQSGKIFRRESSNYNDSTYTPSITNFQYDEKGNMIRYDYLEKDKDGQFKLRGEHFIELTFDSLDRLAKKIEKRSWGFSESGAGSSQIKSIYEYNGLGMLVLKRIEDDSIHFTEHRFSGDTTYIRFNYYDETNEERIINSILVRNPRGQTTLFDERSPVSEGGKLEGRLFQYEYSGEGILLKETLEIWEEGYYVQMKIYEHDSFANIVKETVEWSIIDISGKQKEGKSVTTYSYNYNEKGLLISTYRNPLPVNGKIYHTIEYEYW